MKDIISKIKDYQERLYGNRCNYCGGIVNDKDKREHNNKRSEGEKDGN